MPERLLSLDASTPARTTQPRGLPAAPRSRIRSGVLPGVLFVGLLLLPGAGCTVVGTAPPEAPAPGVLEGPSIGEGERTAARDRAAAEGVAQGEARLAAGDPEGARTLAREVATRYPEAQGSVQAWWLEARASAALRLWDEADEVAGRYLARVGRSTDAGVRAQALRARVRLRGGRDGAVEALFQLPEEASDEPRDEALEVAREVAESLEDAALRDLLREAPRHPWVLPAFQVELGERRTLVGDAEGGRVLAEAALALAPAPTEAERARRILTGEVEGAGTRVAGVLGAVLSEEGSPGLRQLSSQIRAGIEVALLDPTVRGGVRLEVGDDRGEPAQGGAALRGLSERRPLGVVGPLTDPGLAEAARTREGRTVLLSPTARRVPEGVEGVLSIAGADPAAHRALAELIWNDGIRQVVVFHRRDAEEEMELRWFQEAYEARGGQVLRSWSYTPGTTTFSDPLRAIAAMRPRALLVIAPPEDVELVAPQLAFFGVDDTADLRIYGNSAWSTPSVLQNVPVRHTDGVRTVAVWAGEGYGPGWARFVEAYESHFQRTLRSPVPGLGWDAARLLLEAASLEGNSPEEVARGLTRIRGLEGATGTFSWERGRISRHYFPVRIENRTLLPLSEDR